MCAFNVLISFVYLSQKI